MYCIECGLFSTRLFLCFCNRTRFFLIIHIIHKHLYYNNAKSCQEAGEGEWVFLLLGEGKFANAL